MNPCRAQLLATLAVVLVATAFSAPARSDAPPKPRGLWFWSEPSGRGGSVNIRSEALISDGSFATSAHRTKLLAAADRILASNATQPTPAAKRALLEDYLAACTALRAHLETYGGRDLALSAALASWLDRLPPDGGLAWASPTDRDDWFARLTRAVASISLMAYKRPRPTAILDAAAWEQKHFSGRTIIALRPRRGVEWKSLADLTAVLPVVEARQPTGIDLENYELLHLAERAAAHP